MSPRRLIPRVDIQNEKWRTTEARLIGHPRRAVVLPRAVEDRPDREAHHGMAGVAARRVAQGIHRDARNHVGHDNRERPLGLPHARYAEGPPPEK